MGREGNSLTSIRTEGHPVSWRRGLLGDLARIAASTTTAFIRATLDEPEVAEGMLGWLHSGFSVNDAVWLDQDDRPAHERLARYCARNPVSLDRLEYDPEAGEDGEITYTSDKATGPTVGRHSFDRLDFVAMVVDHIPDKGQVLQRYYGYYASRTRGERRKTAEGAGVGEVKVAAQDYKRRQMRLRWAALRGGALEGAAADPAKGCGTVGAGSGAIRGHKRRVGAGPRPVDGPLTASGPRASLIPGDADSYPSGTDTKVITEWNGFMIDALARGAAMTGREEWLRAARRAAEFVLGPMRRGDGELVHSWREARVGVPAFLEDYMAMANAALSLWHADFDQAWFENAEALVLSALERFGAGEGLMDRSGPLHEALVAQRSDIIDGSTPSGNAQAAEALWRLGALIHEPALGERAARIVEHALAIAATSPLAVGASLSVAAALAGGVREVAVLSEGGAGDPLLQAARSLPVPGVVVAWAPEERRSHPVPWLAGRPMPGGEAAAYVCSGMTCGAPIRDAEGLRAALGFGLA